MPSVKQYGFQTPATAMMEEIIDLHHDICVYLLLIIFFVGSIVFYILSEHSLFLKGDDQADGVVDGMEEGVFVGRVPQPDNGIKFLPGTNFTHNTFLEQVGTFLPAVILLVIASPSFALLYSVDSLTEPHVTVIVTGQQWYGTYGYVDNVNLSVLEFDSYMLSLDALQSDEKYFGALRLLEVDRRLHLPGRISLRIEVTGNDVIHSWAIPAFGVKMDAVPGRINQISLFVDRFGVYYGQCSELCGSKHSFMPIVVAIESPQRYVAGAGGLTTY